MEERRIIIGAIGGDKQREAAYAFGEAVAASGCILLTGGGDRDDDEVKNASVQGAAAAERSGAIARIVGILPSDQLAWQRFPHRLLLHTGLKHNLRNVINGVTPDTLVVFGGSRGTLAEAAFAAAAGRDLFYYGGQGGGAVKRLSSNFAVHFGTNNDANAHTEFYLRQPLDAFPRAWHERWTPEALKSLLARLIAQATDWSGTPGGLAERCVAAVRAKGPLGPTGFCGLPGDPGAKQLFETEIRRISA
jgi:uncharacterized protein (TIGR00725 family)